MAAWNSEIYMILLFLATCSTAPSNDGNSLEVPKACKGKVGFCSVKPKGYDKLAEKMLAVLPTYLKKEYGQRDNTEDMPIYEETPRNNTIHSCPYITRKEKVYQYIYDVDETRVDTLPQIPYFSQYVTTIQCQYGPQAITKKEIQLKRECFNKVLVDGLSSKCTQTNSERALYVFDGSTIVPKRFIIPSCCSCDIYS